MVKQRRRKASATKRNAGAKWKRVRRVPKVPGSVITSTIREQIVETEQTILSLKAILHDAMRELRENGDEVTVQVCDRNGKRVEKQRANPAMKRTREVAANLRSLQRYLADLLEEEAVLKRSTSVSQDVDSLDELLNQEGARHDES
jgi:preprotein translocase subunit SecD